MRAVNIRELKARLSSYLREVRGGEVVLVTDRGTVVAELRPPGADARTAAMPAGLSRLIEQGRLAPPSSPHDASIYRRPAGVRLDAATIDQALDFVRGDR